MNSVIAINLDLYSGMLEDWVGPLEKGSTLRLEPIGIKVTLLKCTENWQFFEYLQASLMTLSHGPVNGKVGWL